MNPNDLSVPELHNLLARKGEEVDTGHNNKFYNDLDSEQKRVLDMVIDRRVYPLKDLEYSNDLWLTVLNDLKLWREITKDQWKGIVSELPNTTDDINKRDSELMIEVIKKIFLNYNSFVYFKSYVEFRMFSNVQKNVLKPVEQKVA